MRLSFHGACSEVTGSNILIESRNQKILLDCGLFQGPRLHEEKNFSGFGYSPSEINALVLCHAHLDHVGRTPKLVKEGFRGRIYSTGPTKELAQLVLADNEKLMHDEVEKHGGELLYDLADLERTVPLFETIPYGERIEIVPGIKLTLLNAGHILGSCVCVIEAEGKKLAYTSDLGNNPSLLLESPTRVASADYLISESTYGGRTHEDINLRTQKLAWVLENTIKDSGVLLIPSFAIERTQELLHDIDHFCSIEGCNRPMFYLDSPLAQKVTAVYGKYPEFLGSNIRSNHLDNDFFGLERVQITQTVDESKEINDAPSPKVIIAGAGMMNGGRILHHAKRYLPDSKNTLLIVGYQAKGSLGRRILDGDTEVKIHGERVPVNAKVKAIGSYSAHADAPQLENYIKSIAGLKRVFFVHGEPEESQAIANTVSTKIGIVSIIPETGKYYEL
ncbi:MBL fold metallo-hydrolase [Candidatus Curtissbacteria bacterium]|nr:MBL fold metallo-hydrolase [Candidatus Curtissbacteria bacterium]